MRSVFATIETGKFFGLLFVFLLSAGAAAGQQISRFDASAGYTVLRSNAPPNGCGCFWMNGGTASASFNVFRDLGVVADFTSVTNANVDASGESLTLLSYLFGPRVSWRTASRFTPFGEALFGAVHASGLDYGSERSASALALAVGGGVDLGVSRHFALRLVEADYNLTQLSNGLNGNQNNLRLTFGVVFRFGQH